MKSRLRILALLFFGGALAQCRNAAAPSVRDTIDRLQPDKRIMQAETFFQQNDTKWALYAWNQTRWEDLVSDEARETYRLLKTWLFTQPVADGMQDLQVSAMYLDYDDLWLGTWNGGIYRLSLSSGENFALERDTPSLVPKVVHRIRKSGNAFWFAMYQGLRFYNYQTGLNGWLPIPSVSQAISDFLENSQGLFVSSFTQGIWRYTLEGNTSPIENKALGSAIAVLTYHDDIGLLIGTVKQGAFRWKNGAVESLAKLQPILGRLKHVSHIADDGRSLWFASLGEGLFNWNYLRGEAYQISSESFLLRSDRVSALSHSGDWVFIGDEKGGIAGYHLQDQKWYVWDSGRNLEFSSISTLAYRDGKLFYSTLTGGIYQIHWLKYLFALKQKKK